MSLHSLLARQLKRLGLTGDSPPSAQAWRDFLALVQRTYVESDQDRYALERSLTISSNEMQCLYERLSKTNDILEARVQERTTELQRTEELLRQAQKMEAIGRLAGGIAHDFNNQLSVILGYSDLVQSKLELGDPRRGDIGEIIKAGSCAADLTRQLLAFSRRQVLQPKILDLNELTSGMQNMLRRLVGEDIEVRVAPLATGKVKCDPGQMEQVVMNLVLNARDAMPQGGTLTIETSDVDLDEVYAGQHIGTAAGAHVMLAVSDTGVGMDRATSARIFDPFFTTKEKGKGTGLGLSTVYGIVTQSGGSILVYSEPGQGTIFKVYLPRTDETVEEKKSDVRAAQRRGTETVLVVEDEQQLRVLACNILQRMGYSVLQAQNGGEALLLCEQYPGTIQLLLTDIVMPQLNGLQLAERVGELRPAMKVIFMSGYTDDMIGQHGVLDANMAFLQKPLMPDALVGKVREVLDTPAGQFEARHFPVMFRHSAQ